MSQMPWPTRLPWQALGRVTPEGGCPKYLCEFKKSHGLYCFHFLRENYFYIGQSGRLGDRLKEYWRPTLGTLQEYFIRQALIDNGSTNLFICSFEENILEMSANHCRFIETSEINAARDAKFKLLNRDKALDDYGKKISMKACESMLEDWFKERKIIDKHPFQENDTCR
jgi:hypothetical protein